MSDIFVVGALHLDVVVEAPRLPMLDETLFGDSVAYRFGGKGGNQALAAARMGAQVSMAGRVGEDAFAGRVLEVLQASGVDLSQVRQVPGATGMSVAIVEAAGDYGAVVVSGVNQTIAAAEVDAGSARIVLLQNEIPEAVNLAVVRRKAPGMKVVLNAAPARAMATELLRGVDVLIVNRVEAAQMTSVTAEGLDPEGAAIALQAFGPSAVVVTLGADGAVVLEEDRLDWVRPPLSATGSAHGAGDTFVGTLAAEMAGGQSLQDAAGFAAAAAAFFVGLEPDARPAMTRASVGTWLSTL